MAKTQDFLWKSIYLPWRKKKQRWTKVIDSLSWRKLKRLADRSSNIASDKISTLDWTIPTGRNHFITRQPQGRHFGRSSATYSQNFICVSGAYLILGCLNLILSMKLNGWPWVGHFVDQTEMLRRLKGERDEKISPVFVVQRIFSTQSFEFTKA